MTPAESFLRLLSEVNKPGSLIEGFDLYVHPDTAREHGFEHVSERVKIDQLVPKGEIFAIPNGRIELAPQKH